MRKKFKDGLESLFDIKEEEQIVHYGKEEQKAVAVEAVKVAPRTKRSGKDFTDDLGHAMQDAFVKTEDHFLPMEDNMRISEISKRSHRRPLSGLESLLRQTIDSEELNNETKRRIVLIIESGKVEKLKSIAKDESLFLKDIIERCVNLFLDEYEHKNAIQ